MFKKGFANQAARRDMEARVASRKRAQALTIEDRILNVNQGNYDELVQQFANIGKTKGYLLPNTGENVIIVADNEQELNEVLSHWLSYNYGGSLFPDLYFWDPYVDSGEVADISEEFTDNEWDFMHEKALKGAKLVDLQR